MPIYATFALANPCATPSPAPVCQPSHFFRGPVLVNLFFSLVSTSSLYLFPSFSFFASSFPTAALYSTGPLFLEPLLFLGPVVHLNQSLLSLSYPSNPRPPPNYTGGRNSVKSGI